MPLEVEIYFTNAIGNVYESQGADDLAMEQYNLGIDLCERLPVGHPEGALSYMNLGAIYYHLSKYEYALALFEKARVIREEILLTDTKVVHTHEEDVAEAAKRRSSAAGSGRGSGFGIADAASEDADERDQVKP